MRVRHDDDRLVDVVEDDHTVVQREAKVRQAAVVGRRMVEALNVADRVVPRVADGAAEETWQAVQMRSTIALDDFFEQPQ